MMVYRQLLVAVVVVLIFCNIMYFLVINRQNVITAEVRSTGDIFTQNKTFFVRKESISTEMEQQPTLQTVNMEMSLIRREKIEAMKRDINDSTLINEANLPGNLVNGYIVANPHLCQDIVHLVIIVHTAPANFDRRKRMRNSFAKKSLFLPFQLRIAFLLGTTKDKDLNLKLMQENDNYSDSVIGDFIDDYHNLTLKGVMGYRWVSEHCSNARFVLKIDDDVLINTYKILYSLLNHMSGKKKSIFCNVWHKGTMSILRDGKWKVDSHIFSKRGEFPYDYCSGFLVLLTTDLMAPLYQASKVSPFFWVDDVYLYGMLPYLVGGVSYYEHSLDKSITLIEEQADNCTIKLGPRCPLFGTAISNNRFWSMWNTIKGIYDSTIWNVNKRFVP